MELPQIKTSVGVGRASRTAAPDPTAEALSLGGLEAEVLVLLWEVGEPATAMAVAEAAVYRRRGRGQEPPNFATVATTLRRLAEKGLVTASKDGGRSPYYAPALTRDEMACRILNNVSRVLLGKPLAEVLDSGDDFGRLFPMLSALTADATREKVVA